MAKAGGEPTTTWIRYSEAKALAVEYLGDPEFVERELLKGLAAGVLWRCVRFDAPKGYSGPGAGDRKFWCKPDNLITNERGILIAELEWLVIKGDSAERRHGAAARGVDLDRSALVKLKLLPPDDVAGDETLAKFWVPLVARDLKRAGKLGQVTKKIKLADLILKAGVAAGRDKVSVEYIGDILKKLDCWPISKIKTD